MKEPESTIFIHETGSSICFRWLCQDSDVWQDMRTDLKRSFPHHTGLTFDGELRMWRLPLRTRDRFCRWADAWFGMNGQRWETVGEDSGYTRSKATQSSVAGSVESAYAALHLLPTAPAEVVRAAQRALVKMHHPDAGGTHAAAVAINRAVDIIHIYQSTARSGAA